MSAARASKKILYVGLALLAVLPPLGYGALRGLRTMGRELQCSMTLAYGWGSPVGLFHAYTESNPDGKYPPMSAIPGNFFPALARLAPYMTPDHRRYTLNCYAYSDPRKSLPLEDQFRQPSYAYFGYALANEDQLLAFLESYPTFLASGADFDADLPAPKGRGSFGGDTFQRLSAPLVSGAREAGQSLPILIELPEKHDGQLHFPHPGQRLKVLYPAGNFDPKDYGAEFPTTHAIINQILELKARYATQTIYGQQACHRPAKRIVSRP